MTSAFSSTMSPADVDSFLSQMERPPQGGAQPASNRLRVLSSRRELPHHRPDARSVTAPILLPSGDDPFSAGNNNNSSNARFNASSGSGFPDNSDEDDAALLLPRLIYPGSPTREETIAKHIRFTTVYDPLNPPPDDEDTRQGTALGLRPDYEGRLFHHQTLRLGRWCHMTGHRVDRSELLDVEKEMLDWKFEQPAPRRRIPSRVAIGRGCMGAYLRRRNRIPRYEVTRRRMGAIRRPREVATGTKRPQRGSSAATVAAATKSPPRVTGPVSVSVTTRNAPPLSIATSKTGDQESGATTAPQRTRKSSTTALAEAFSEWNAKKARGEPVGTPQDVLAAVAKRSGTTPPSAALSPTSTGRSAPKSPTKQQQGGLPPRFLMPDGRVSISKVLDEQMEFIANGGRADEFFAQYPGLQDIMARPDQMMQANPFTTTPPPTTKRPTPFTQRRPDRIPTIHVDHRRRARVTEVDAAGNEIAADSEEDDDAAPFARQRDTATTSSTTTYRVNPAFPSSSSLSPPSARKREGGAAGGAASVKSLRLDRTGAASKRNVTWAPLPGEQPDDDYIDDNVEEIPHQEMQGEVVSSPQQSRWSPGGTLRAGRAGRGRYGWR